MQNIKQKTTSSYVVGSNSTRYPKNLSPFDYTTINPIFHLHSHSPPSHKTHHPCTSYLSVFRTNEISEGLGFFVTVVVVVVVVILGPDVLHLQDVAALWASLDRAIAGHLVFF